jgi:hypothetical protein
MLTSNFGASMAMANDSLRILCAVKQINIEIYADQVQQRRSSTSYMRQCVAALQGYASGLAEFDLHSDGSMNWDARDQLIMQAADVAPRPNGYQWDEYKNILAKDHWPLLPHHNGHWLARRLWAAGLSRQGVSQEEEHSRLSILEKMQEMQIRRLAQGYAHANMEFNQIAADFRRVGLVMAGVGIYL